MATTSCWKPSKAKPHGGPEWPLPSPETGWACLPYMGGRRASLAGAGLSLNRTLELL